MRDGIPHRGLAMTLLIATAAAAQVSYQGKANAARLDRQLSWSGPGAALRNPAHLAETRTVHTLISLYDHERAKGFHPLAQAAAALPDLGLAAGFAAFWNDGRIDNSNAIFHEGAYVPMAALAWSPSAAGPRLALGLAVPSHRYNSFGAVKSSSQGLDAGCLSTWDLGPAWGTAQAGAAVLNLLRPRVKLPDGRGHYEILREFDFSLTWTSPGRAWMGHATVFLDGKQEASEGPQPGDRLGTKLLGLEAKPLPWFGWMVERASTGEISTGPVFRYHEEHGWDIACELNYAHEMLIGIDDGRGSIWSGYLSGGF